MKRWTSASSSIGTAVWRGPYEDGTLFFHLDEYAKDAPKDLLALLASTGQYLRRALKKQHTLVEKKHRRARRPAAAQSRRARVAAVRHACALTSATCAACWSSSRSTTRRKRTRRSPRSRGVPAHEIGDALRAGLTARAHRTGGQPDFRAQHHRSRRPDEGQRQAAAGADARIPRSQRADGGVHAAGQRQRADASRLPLHRCRRAGAGRPVEERGARKGAGGSTC